MIQRDNAQSHRHLLEAVLQKGAGRVGRQLRRAGRRLRRQLLLLGLLPRRRQRVANGSVSAAALAAKAANRGKEAAGALRAIAVAKSAAAAFAASVVARDAGERAGNRRNRGRAAVAAIEVAVAACTCRESCRSRTRQTF